MIHSSTVTHLRYCCMGFDIYCGEFTVLEYARKLDDAKIGKVLMILEQDIYPSHNHDNYDRITSKIERFPIMINASKTSIVTKTKVNCF